MVTLPAFLKDDTLSHHMPIRMEISRTTEELTTIAEVRSHMQLENEGLATNVGNVPLTANWFVVVTHQRGSYSSSLFARGSHQNCLLR
jgi:hypothetical protein